MMDNEEKMWTSITNVTNHVKEETEIEVKRMIAYEIKRVIIVNRASPEEQARMVMNDPYVYDLLISPSDEATQAYIMKTQL